MVTLSPFPKKRLFVHGGPRFPVSKNVLIHFKSNIASNLTIEHRNGATRAYKGREVQRNGSDRWRDFELVAREAVTT